jgi:hypothetical protein
MPLFHRYIGIDYSGAATPSDALSGLTVAVAHRETESDLQRCPEHPRGRWSRKSLATWLCQRLLEDTPTIVGIDHAFSYPLEAIGAAAQRSWGEFLEWFEGRWPTLGNADEQTVKKCIAVNLKELKAHEGKLRLTDSWTPTAMPICSKWEGKGPTVFFSTHAGIPQLRWLRQHVGDKVHFWPFDGFSVPPGKSAVAEVYPRIFRRRYETNLEGDERDAWLVCRWLKARDEKDLLAPYFQPPLDEEERRLVRVEGWILGVA